MYIGWVGLAFGVVARIFVPWLHERRVNPDEAKWSWRFVWPQLVAVVIVALLMPLVIPNLDTVGEMSFGGAAIIGWGVADVGRFADKLVFKS